MTATVCREQHCIDRALERYGLAVNRSDLREIAYRIHAGAGRCIIWQGPNRAVFELDVNRIPCMVVYDGESRELRTFLPARAEKTDAEYADNLKAYFDWETEN